MADGATTSPSTPAAKPDMGEFVHLHLHTEYSLLDGGNRIDKLVARVAELGMKAVGVTDHGNIFGAVAFYTACKDKGVKPILGVEAYVTPPGKPRTDRTYSGGARAGFTWCCWRRTTRGGGTCCTCAARRTSRGSTTSRGLTGRSWRSTARG